jgi:hypothetical protein
LIIKVQQASTIQPRIQEKDEKYLAIYPSKKRNSDFTPYTIDKHPYYHGEKTGL